ncbi:MAG: hypothetical protein ACRDWV_07395 [Acidimicrobiales bacterium]
MRTAYLEYWRALIEASAQANPRLPALAATTASRQLALVERNLAEDNDLHAFARGKVVHQIRAVTMGRTTASVVDCVDVDGWRLYSAATGRLLSQLMKRPHQLVAYTLGQDARAGWKVTDDQVLGSC